MVDLAAFERTPYLTELQTTVVRVGEDRGRPFAVLEDTVLYPEGGGQPADHGQVAGVPVLDVQTRDGEIRHYLAEPVPVGPARLTLDWSRRFEHMQQHTGQHLLTAVAQDRFGWATTAFHLGDQVADIELAVAQLGEADLDRLEAAVAAEIRAGHGVTSQRVAPERLAELGVRSRGLPEGFQGQVRLVAIAGLDLNTCGGTHVASTAELECLKLLGTESVRGGTRLFFVVGGRVRRRLGEAERRNAQLRTLLGSPDEGLVPALASRLEQTKGLERRLRALEEELLEGLVTRLASQPGSFVEAHCPGQDSGFLQRAARSLAAAAPAKTALLTASVGQAHGFVLCAGEAAAVDLPALGREAAALLEAKGGGSSRLFQGKAGSLARRPELVALLQGRC